VSVVTREILREKKLLALIFSSIFLVTGCSSSTTSQEQAVKLVEYERCLDWQQGLTTQLNNSLTEMFPKEPEFIYELLMEQGKIDTKTGLGLRFEQHLKNCLPYRP
jgi:hypothetical protein